MSDRFACVEYRGDWRLSFVWGKNFPCFVFLFDVFLRFLKDLPLERSEMNRTKEVAC